MCRRCSCETHARALDHGEAFCASARMVRARMVSGARARGAGRAEKQAGAYGEEDARADGGLHLAEGAPERAAQMPLAAC
jgi:hypothetical protein